MPDNDDFDGENEGSDELSERPAGLADVIELNASPAARRQLTEDAWNRLVEGFRKTPGQYRPAAQFAGVDQRTAKKAYHQGLAWPLCARKPIWVILEDERKENAKIAAVIVACETPAGASDGARASAEPGVSATRTEKIRTRADEIRMVRTARTNTIGLLASTTVLLKAGIRLSEEAAKVMVQAATAGGQDPGKVVKLLKDLAALNEAGAKSAKAALAMERILSGENPTGDVGEMTAEQAQEELVAMERALTARREKQQA
jgi:hypothetical protein